MIKYVDHRMLPIAYLREGGALLLDDETAQAYAEGDYPTHTLELPGWDAELKILQITGLRGNQLPDEHAPHLREELRRRIRTCIEKFSIDVCDLGERRCLGTCRQENFMTTENDLILQNFDKGCDGMLPTTSCSASSDVRRMVFAFDDKGRQDEVRRIAARVKNLEDALTAMHAHYRQWSIPAELFRQVESALGLPNHFPKKNPNETLPNQPRGGDPGQREHSNGVGR
jgi:hypothetical protein